MVMKSLTFALLQGNPFLASTRSAALPYPTQRSVATQPKFEFTLDSGNLIEEQRKFYEENGFIIIPKLVPDNKLEKYTRRFRDVANGVVKVRGLVTQRDVSYLDQPKTERTVYNAQNLYADEELFDHCRLDGIINYAENVCGKNVMAMHSMVINKPPDAGKKTTRHPLHQDWHYMLFGPANSIVCSWTAMEQTTRDNGCLAVIPGSHKGPLLSHDYPKWKGLLDKNGYGAEGMDIKERVLLEMNPGDTVFFHPLLLHGSGANRTKGCRKAISCHFAAAECEYFDVKGTSREKMASENLEAIKQKFGVDWSYEYVWQFKGRLVRGKQVSL